MSRKKGSSRLQIVRRSVELPSSSLPSAPRSMVFVYPRHPVTSSRPRRQAPLLTPIVWHGISNQPLRRKKKAIGRYTYGVNNSPEQLLEVFESRPSNLQKNAAALSSPNVNLPTKQRAPRSQKRAGAETTLRPAWIKYPILP